MWPCTVRLGLAASGQRRGKPGAVGNVIGVAQLDPETDHYGFRRPLALPVDGRIWQHLQFQSHVRRQGLFPMLVNRLHTPSLNAIVA